MLGFHRRNDAGITLFTHPNAHPYDSDLVSADYGGRVRGIIKKGGARSGLYYGNNVNAGFFIVNPRTLGFFDTPEEVGMEHDFVGALIDGGERVFAYKSTEYIKDAGTPSRFDSVAADIKSGTVSGKNLKNKQRAVFLDRDGTVNKYKGFISDAAQIELTDRAAEAIRLINKSGYLAIVVSNQPVIARGEATAAEVEKMHKKIETLLGAENAYLDDILYCPHHPDSGYPGEVAALKIKCDCRKPGTGMFIVAVEKYNIDLKASCMIGDSDVDVEAGHNAGMPAVRINSGLAERGSEAAENRAENLLDAVKIFLGGDL
jgi:D,D-heptose 1,7-bisphosphate phosphatase